MPCLDMLPGGSPGQGSLPRLKNCSNQGLNPEPFDHNSLPLSLKQLFNIPTFKADLIDHLPDIAKPTSSRLSVTTWILWKPATISFSTTLGEACLELLKTSRPGVHGL